MLVGYKPPNLDQLKRFRTRAVRIQNDANPRRRLSNRQASRKKKTSNQAAWPNRVFLFCSGERRRRSAAGSASSVCWLAQLPSSRIIGRAERGRESVESQSTGESQQKRTNRLGRQQERRDCSFARQSWLPSGCFRVRFRLARSRPGRDR